MFQPLKFATIEDIEKVKELGAFGVVIGSALYFGKIDSKTLFTRIYKKPE